MRKNRATVITLLISIVVLLVLLAVTNWPFGGGVAIGKAAPRDVAANIPELKDGAILAANRWPDACSFVDQKEIKAIFPDAKDIGQESRPVYALSIKDFAADSSWKARDASESGQCLYSMRLPGETYAATQFWLRIEAVADPKLIAGYDDRVGSGIKTPQGAGGADRCVITGLAEGSWHCRKGPLLFSVGGQTTVTFKGEQDAAPFAWRDDVLPEFVRTVAAKIK
ncbi:hypothetical protein OG204_16235 [Streptomyces sp. NBC_01387]|uniref:hypothetical protein n=1 Tax=unclassified Streptomyces TaxID=2593676 RepID=UPI00225905A5|nr:MULTISPECIES: hypothetical protein [unclassified Streptomyces]MCX4550081.1 hypothetical protein [Streptomyces sp. NBC_01500]